jgi:hypothetical protein
MPYALQVITHIVPARYFLIALPRHRPQGHTAAPALAQMVALSIYATPGC